MQARPHPVGEVLLSVEGVSLAFGGVKALSDVSFDVRSHEVRAIIGPNGAGKSSMLNVLNGVYHPQRGTIRFRGREFRDMDSHQTAAMGVARPMVSIKPPPASRDRDSGCAAEGHPSREHSRTLNVLRSSGAVVRVAAVRFACDSIRA